MSSSSLRPRRKAAPSPSPHPQRVGNDRGGGSSSSSNLQFLASSAFSSSSSSAAPAPAPKKSWFAELLSIPPPPPPPREPPSKRTDTSPPISPPPQQQLVYVHPVTASTTLQGVVIAFDTSAAAVLRTNQLWPGDPLQSRRELLIPVDACRIKGRPCPGDGDGTDGDRYEHHSFTELPAPLGKTQIARLKQRRASRRRKITPPPPPDTPEEIAVPKRPSWMTPGVHTFHPEEEAQLPEWGEIVKGAEVVGGRVEGWVRRLGEGLMTAADRGGLGELKGELIEMVGGIGGVRLEDHNEEDGDGETWMGDGGTGTGWNHGGGERRRTRGKDV